jgi:CheY-like chemotaxis protein
MRILVLDDDEIRLDKFRQGLIGKVVDCVKTATEAIKLLQENVYNMLFLDHDLGGRINVSSGPGTGYEVAKWLEEHPDRKPKHIYLHSFNEAGRNNMRMALPEAIVYPGVWLILKGEEEINNV